MRLLQENDFGKALKDRLLPVLSAARTDGYFAGYDAQPLHFARFDAGKPRGSVVILHGLNESIEKYRELIAYLLEDGLSVAIYEQRGHALSYRAAPLPRIHVEHFEDYLADFDCFLDTVVADMPSPYYLYSHSMGGGVAALWLTRGEPFFEKAVLSSPMMAPALGGLPRPFAKLLCTLARDMKCGAKKALFTKDRGADEPFSHSAALSPARFAAYAEVRRSDPRYASGAPSFAWVYEAIVLQDKLLRPGAPEAIGIPVRLYQAERDRLVEPQPQEAFIARVPQGELLRVAGAKHELLFASDDILHPYIEGLLDYFR